MRSLFAAAAGEELFEAFLDEFGGGELDAKFLGEFEGEAEVFVLMHGFETGREVAFEDFVTLLDYAAFT